jgi:UDP-glucuronate 4-epimerase
MKILVTGGAGFIGSHTCEHLLAHGHAVVAVDNFDPFYPEERKRRNVAGMLTNSNFRLVEGDFGDRIAITKLLETERFDVILHLAAQAGVRPSLTDPLKYERVNVGNLISLLEAMRQCGPMKIVAASSSSVYGNSTPSPFREDAPCLEPLSPYAATKRASEIFLGTYAQLHKLKAIVVRPFTVYGPRQRPDMAIATFARKVLLDEIITLYGDGTTARDYSFVSDIVAGLDAALRKIGTVTEGDWPCFSIYNLGGGKPVSLNDMVSTLEKVTGKKARIERAPMQPGDVERTCADISRVAQDLGYDPKVGLEEGLTYTVSWVKGELQREGRSV